MEHFQKIIQRVVEKIYEDERLRSNLSDDEAKVVLGWADKWIEAQISSAADEPSAQRIAQSELTRVRQAVSTMNTLAEKPGALRLSEALAAFEPQMQVTAIMPRDRVFKHLTEIISAMWMPVEHTSAMKDKHSK